MHWQSKGDYLCLLTTKVSKTGKKGNTNLEIFRIRARNIPVDIVELRDTVTGFFWETKSNRFAVMTKDEAGHRPKIQFYALGNEKCENVQTFDLPASSFTDMFWAPNGQYFVCAAMGHGDLVFAGLMPDHKLELLHKDEHFMVTDVLWDPSSRFVITAVSQPMRDEAGGYRYQMEAGYAIWTFQGRNLYKQQKEKLWQVAWRPHPPSMLADQKQKEIRKNIKQFSKRYDALDDHAKESARQAFRQDRDEKMGGFREVLERLEDYRAENVEENGWDEAWAAHAENQGWEMDETNLEEELDASEELISG
jgi:translation initiation factor 3 subunit B